MGVGRDALTKLGDKANDEGIESLDVGEDIRGGFATSNELVGRDGGRESDGHEAEDGEEGEDELGEEHGCCWDVAARSKANASLGGWRTRWKRSRVR